MAPIYCGLGLSVGALQNMSRQREARPYQADITYCTNWEFGFDQLRDRWRTSLTKKNSATAVAASRTVS